MFDTAFSDYDAYAEAIGHANARFILQRPRRRQWRVSGASLPAGINIQHCQSGSGAIARGVATGEGVQLAIPQAGQFVANGETVPAEAALHMSPHEEFLVSIPGSHRWFGVFLPASQADAIGLLEHAGKQSASNHVIHNAYQASRPVSSLLQRFLSTALASPEVAWCEESQTRFQQELLSVLEACYGNRPPVVRKRRGRSAVVDRKTTLLAVEVIEASGNPAIPISELVRMTNISERSLRAGFQKYLGLSPTRYMQLQTLDRARQRLTTGAPGKTTVARVAADLGIWDLGRFAMRYRQTFGELPSATLLRR